MKTAPLIRKEFKEIISTYKIVILPIAFIFITIMVPISMKLLPEIIKSSGDLPKGTIINMPKMTSPDILGSLLSNFTSIGYFIIVLILIPIITGERNSGVAHMILSKPISIKRYFFSKVFSYGILIIVCMYISIIVATYYTEILFGKVSWGGVLLGTTVFIPNLILVIACTLFTSSFIKNQVVVGAISLLIIILLSTVPQYMGSFINSFSPDNLMKNASIIMQEGIKRSVLKPIFGVLSIGAILLILGCGILKKQEI